MVRAFPYVIAGVGDTLEYKGNARTFFIYNSFGINTILIITYGAFDSEFGLAVHLYGS